MKKTIFSILSALVLVGGIVIGDGSAQTPPLTYTISGNVRATNGITGIQGVTMNSLPGNPKTDDNGYYSAQVPSGWSGTVKPKKIGYAIHPASQVYSDVASNLTMNYGATLLPKVAVVPDKRTYYPGEAIMITMDIQNQGGDIITTKGFMEKNFHLTLRFYDPEGKLITSNVQTGFTPPPPLVVPIIIDNKVQMLPVEYVETVPVNWVLSTTFNALDYYTLTKGGNYSVKARFDMSDYLEKFETSPGSGVFYAELDTGSPGDVESNIESFTLFVVDHITISPTSSTITAGGNQSYTVTAYDQNGNASNVTNTSSFSIVPDGSCTGNSCTAKVGGLHTVTATYGGKTPTANLQVNYNYAGFFSPVDNPPTVNAAKAGQAIPVKWRITDVNGAGISDPNSFKGFTITSISCTTLDVYPQSQIEEYTDTSGLKYLGNGNWQYNWKTPKNYASTCKKVNLNLSDGMTYTDQTKSNTAEFKFK